MMSAPAPASSQIQITLPDGSAKSLPRGATGADVAAAIGPGLAKDALAIQVDGKMWDLDRPIEADAKVRIITRKDEEALEMIRHDAAHMLAMAAQELFPGTKIAIGPPIEDGFYYDMDPPQPFTPEDLPRIEARMRELVKEDLPVHREVWARDKATKHYEQRNEDYKVELIRDLPPGEDGT